MLATVRGVGNGVGHTHGRTCKVKTLTPAKATLVALHYIVWQHYFYFLFFDGFLWRFKEVFYMEPLLAFLKSSKTLIPRHWGCTHMYVDANKCPSKGCLFLPSLAERGGGGWRWRAHSHAYCLWMWLKSPYYSPHPHQNSVSFKSPHKVSDRNMNYLFKNLRVCLDPEKGLEKILNSNSWYEAKIDMK